ncbi:MAG: PspC domain-containing protein [Anaerolineae bacterium]|jgi:phage shock protein C
MDRLYRSSTNRVIGGVCGGLAEYFKVDAEIVRILFVTLAIMFSGTGLPVYLLLWLFIPEREAAFADTDDSIRQNVGDIKSTFGQFRQRHWGNANSSDRLLIGGAILVGVGLLLLLRNLNVLGFFNDLWPLGVIAVGILILIQNIKK